jgi:hypothetical protein
MTGASEDDRKAKKTGRLAAALRENLRRRKAQERRRETQVAPAVGKSARPAHDEKDD